MKDKLHRETLLANNDALEPFTEILLGCAAFAQRIHSSAELPQPTTQRRGDEEYDDWTYIMLGAAFGWDNIKKQIPAQAEPRQELGVWDDKERLLR